MEERVLRVRYSQDPVWSGVKPPANLDIAGARKGVGCNNVTGGGVMSSREIIISDNLLPPSTLHLVL